MKKLAGGMALLGFKDYFSTKNFITPSNNYIIDNPYSNVNWSTDKHIISTSHVHIENQEKLDRIYSAGKLRHLPISNYYPSAPYYPLKSIRENQFKVKQNFGVMHGVKGKKRVMMEGPILWNEIIMDKEKGWFDDLPGELKQQMPFKEGDILFPNIPKDLIVSPNAEHHAFINTNGRMHINSLGSLYSSGTFDQHYRFQTGQHGYSFGTGAKWQDVFSDILNQLLFPDGGGITINHPTWSDLSREEIVQMLDYDPRVLGIEVFNDTCAIEFGDPAQGWALKTWDEILKTGRRCLGFFVPDHSYSGRGKNVLLVDKHTEENCLRAYREGRFYGAIQGSGLGFINISLNDNTLIAETNMESTMRVVTDQGVALLEWRTTKLVYNIPFDSSGLPQIKYIRVEANDPSSEQIYSQPIRFI